MLVMWEQEDGASGLDHPVYYFSKKVSKHQKHYSTLENEYLSLILSVQHFEVYISSSFSSSLVTFYTDHNPLTFHREMKNKNQRVLR